MSKLGQLGAAACDKERKNGRSILRERVEQNTERIWQTFEEGMKATTESGAPDYRTRVQAASALLQEAYGRPSQDQTVQTLIKIDSYAELDEVWRDPEKRAIAIRSALAIVSESRQQA